MGNLEAHARTASELLNTETAYAQEARAHDRQVPPRTSGVCDAF